MIPKARIVVVEKVYHQQDPDPATIVESLFSRFLDSDDSPIIKRTRVGDSWVPLCPKGYDGSTASCIVVQNMEGRFNLAQPTDAERKEASSRYLEVGICTGRTTMLLTVTETVVPFSYIRPGESIRLSPREISELRIRCISGQARYSIAIFPE